MSNRPDEAINQGSWTRNDTPFVHYTRTNIFQPRYLREMEAQFEEWLHGGVAVDGARVKFAQKIQGYETLTLRLFAGVDGALSILLGWVWHDMLAELCDIQSTGDVLAALHVNPPGTPCGSPHTDLCSGWFPRPARDNARPNMWSAHETDSYMGSTHAARMHAEQTVRAATMILYLNNGPWRPGDGGETGLYCAGVSDPLQYVKKLAPIDNSAVVFECSPQSNHAFLQTAKRRCSVVLWLHRRLQDGVSRWGAEAIGSWPAPPDP